MTRLALCLLLLATGASATENVIDVQHDSQRGVTCYILNDAGISCVPDSQLAGEQRAQDQVGDQLDNSPTPTQAPALWNEERYSL
ncbi:hypothetical protein UIA24_22840 [Pseudomonas sp. AL 58]|uniref:hypothetical protein n=1 Tax=Pseudomonas sp. AL 58 TaxID=3104275 RepID=UPI002EC7CC2E|nr:hypothetical protein [Pseudomonas sp. AL 58]